ncbi:X-ray radiation resistance-associated protein 1 isoform X2 [Paroedura picta]|uniref:X-ray radiation resistance-associated protein 1 isoform X2 n=1 Tax=Paroedura picta TaxID=143630 RepID=UPI0040572F67
MVFCEILHVWGQNDIRVAAGIYKLENGNSHLTNCFPARSLLQPKYAEGAGHWEVARHAAEQTKFEWWFGSKSTRIKWRGPGMPRGPLKHLDEKTLTGALLMKLHQVKIPSHLCSVDISNQNLVSAKEEDFEQFDSVAYMNATENLLTLGAFRKFPALRELELSLNGLRNLKVNAEDFPALEILDLSYNNLSPEDIRALGILPHLKALHLTANGLSSLPLDLAVPDSKDCPKFPALEVLLLDDNHLSHPNVFVSLANLRSLKQLNLDRNGLREVPYLHHLENSRFSIHPLSAKSGIREGLRTRKSAEIQRKLSGLGEQAECVATQSSVDPDRAEVLFAALSPDPSVQGDTPLSRCVSKISAASLGQDFALPLAELRYLSLANNEIEHEEDLLAVALFPSLAELTFYGNPFTTSRSGDPPLLTSFLQDKLGIKLVRKKVSKLEKPRIFIPVKAERKVKSPLPKVRKRPPMVEAPLETTFWQLWTGSDLVISPRTSLDQFEPLPPITSFSAETPKLLSGASSPPSSPSQDNSLSLLPEAQTSLDQLCEVSSLLDQILSASLSSPRPFFDEPLAVSPSAEQGPSPSLLPGQGQSQADTAPPVGTPPTEEEQSERDLPPGSSEQEADPLGRSPPIGSPPTEEDPSQVLQPTSSAGGQPDPAPGSPSEEQALPELLPPTGSPPGEPDLPGSLPPARSTSGVQKLAGSSPSTVKLEPVHSLIGVRDQGRDVSDLLGSPSLSQGEGLSAAESQILSGTIPPARSLLFEAGQLEQTPPGSPPHVQDLSELTSPSEPSSEHPTPSKPVLLVVAPSATQDQPEFGPPAGSAFQEQVLPDSVPSTGPLVTDQDLTEPLPPPEEQIRLETSPPSGAPEERDSLPSVVLTSPGPNGPDTEPLTQLSSIVQEHPKSEISSLPADQGLAKGVSWGKSLCKRPVVSEFSSYAQSSSKDLHLLFERKSSATSVSRVRKTSSEILMDEEMKSFFMTQAAEVADSLENLEKEESQCKEAITLPKTKPRPVPKRYRGYEELLDGSPDPDFIEPRGMQQNVKALEWALQHPLVYREPRARLDSFQTPYVPMERKVWRLPAPAVQKTKAQQLEELLQQMRTPNNIVELPLVCILRQKKSNWREYREALALLKDFRKRYKATVATAREVRSVHRKQSSREKPKEIQMLRSLTGMKVSGPCLKVPRAPSDKEDKGLGSLLRENAAPLQLEPRPVGD